VTGVLVLGSADSERMVISLGAGDLGTDLWWDHERDGRLFQISFVMVSPKREGEKSIVSRYKIGPTATYHHILKPQE
jgi:hypothetical protein